MAVRIAGRSEAIAAGTVGSLGRFVPGLGALAARSGLRALRASGVKVGEWTSRRWERSARGEVLENRREVDLDRVLRDVNGDRIGSTHRLLHMRGPVIS